VDANASSGPLVLAFDVGTQSTRAMLVDTGGNIVRIVQKRYEEPYFSVKNGFAEQRADFYWECIAETSKKLKIEAGSDYDRLIGVTVSTFRDSILCLDENFRPLGDSSALGHDVATHRDGVLQRGEVILWLDERKVENLPPLNPLIAAATKAAGLHAGLALQRTTTHANWIYMHDRERWEKCRYLVFLSAYLNYKFTGRLVDATSNTVGHLPYDPKNSVWMKNTDIRRIVFMPMDDKMISLVPPGTEIGRITPAAFEDTGIPAGASFVVSGSDKGCETLGLSCLTTDRAAVSFGTSATIQVCTDKYFDADPPMPSFTAPVPGRYNPEIQIYRGYWLVSWFIKELAAEERFRAEKTGRMAEEVLNARLSEVKAGCEGLITNPYFTPGVTMPFARGALSGFSEVHTRIHIYRSIIEGINFALREGIEGVEKRGGFKVGELFAGGGGSRSAEICQITANMFNLNVNRIQTNEATGIGAAACVFVAKNVFKNFDEAISGMVHVKDTFYPSKQEAALYDRLYNEVFKKLFGRLSPLYKKAKTILEEAGE
jgi:sugar (pentulose or hexulose) kinase